MSSFFTITVSHSMTQQTTYTVASSASQQETQFIPRHAHELVERKEADSPNKEAADSTNSDFDNAQDAYVPPLQQRSPVKKMPR